MNNFRIITKIIFSFALFFAIYSNSFAASLYLDPVSSNIEVGDTFTATVYVNSQSESINNVEGLLSVSDSLEILNISTSGTILNLWVEQPYVSGKNISFNGGITNPGYTGSSGRILSISLMATKPGIANILFNSASVRLNDGLGTDALNSKSGSSITISSPAPAVIEVPKKPKDDVVESDNDNSTAETEAPESISDDAPVIINSELTPDSEKWYQTNSTNFSWNIPKNAIALKTLFDDNSDSDPTILYNNIFNTKTLNDLDDGVWYFHLNYQTSNGWSRPSHKRINIDNSAPTIDNFDYEILDNNLVKIKVISSDDVSGVSKIDVRVDDSTEYEISNFEKEGEIEYIFSTDHFGDKEVEVLVYDLAGNFISESISIDFPKVEVPVINEYTNFITNNESIDVHGSSSYKNSDIKIYIQNENGDIESFQTKTDGLGIFSYKIDRLKFKSSGTLVMWAQIIFDDERQIIESEKVKIEVRGIGLIQQIKDFNQKIVVFMPTIIMLFMLIASVYFASKKIHEKNSFWDKRRKISLIRKEALDLVDAFKDSVEESITYAKQDIDSRDIRDIENDLLLNLLENFKDTEKIVASKIKRSKRIYKKKNIDSDII